MKHFYSFDPYQNRREFEGFQLKKGRCIQRDDHGKYIWCIVQNEWESWCNSRYSQNKMVIPKPDLLNIFEYSKILENACRQAGIELTWDTEPQLKAVEEYNII